MKTNHTPGPWRAGKRIQDNRIQIHGTSQHPIAFAYCRSDLPDKGRANARLIAAAPDLLEACESALDWIGGRNLDTNPEVKIKAAIAKVLQDTGAPF